MDDQTPFSTHRILTPQERRERNREEMKDAILTTAREIMHQDGAGALNLHELARRVGLRTSSLYVYFSGKMAIYDEIFAFGVQRYLGELKQITQAISDPWEALQMVLERGMEISINSPELFQIVFERPIPGFEPSKDSMDEMDRLTMEMYLLLNRVMPAEVSDPSRYVPPAHGLYIALWQGLIALHLANDPELPVGSGRFGSLIPEAISFLKTVWGKGASSHPLPTIPED